MIVTSSSDVRIPRSSRKTGRQCIGENLRAFRQLCVGPPRNAPPRSCCCWKCSCRRRDHLSGTLPGSTQSALQSENRPRCHWHITEFIDLFNRDLTAGKIRCAGGRSQFADGQRPFMAPLQLSNKAVHQFQICPADGFAASTHDPCHDRGQFERQRTATDGISVSPLPEKISSSPPICAGRKQR